MKKEEARKIAEKAKQCLRNAEFNNPTDEVGYDLYEFELDGQLMNVFAYISKRKDNGREWYSVYAGVEYDGGDNVYADYDNSTEHLQVDELTESIYTLANMYTKQENLLLLKNDCSKIGKQGKV